MLPVCVSRARGDENLATWGKRWCCGAGQRWLCQRQLRPSCRQLDSRTTRKSKQKQLSESPLSLGQVQEKHGSEESRFGSHRPRRAGLEATLFLTEESHGRREVFGSPPPRRSDSVLAFLSVYPANLLSRSADSPMISLPTAQRGGPAGARARERV